MIWGYHGGNHEEYYLLGCNAVYSERARCLAFRGNIISPSSGPKSKWSKKPAETGDKLVSSFSAACLCLFLAWLTVRTSRLRWYVPPKCRASRLHSVTAQGTAFLTAMAVRTSHYISSLFLRVSPIASFSWLARAPSCTHARSSELMFSVARAAVTTCWCLSITNRVFVMPLSTSCCVML
jgi:hypothetical protein